MSDLKHSVLVVGCGSIGERHLRCFLATKRCRVVGCDTRPEIRRHIAETYHVPCLEHWQEALEGPDFSAVVIAVPAPWHVEIARTTLTRGLHVMIEKPLAITLEGTDDLATLRDRSGKIAVVAYTLHMAPALRAARSWLRGATCPFGRLCHVTVTAGQFFPQFRPAYREIYYRDHNQGGGAIQDALTHLANAVEWTAGPTSRLTCDASHQVLEGVTVEDTVNVLARNDGVLVSYALNQFQAPNETRLDFHAERGTVRVEIHLQRWGTQSRGEAEWQWHAAAIPSRDTLYLDQANEFLDACEGRTHQLCTLEEGIQTLRFNLAALESARNHASITL